MRGSEVWNENSECHKEAHRTPCVVSLAMSNNAQWAMLTFLCVCFVFQDRVSLYSPGCPGTHFVDQAGLEIRNPPASPFQVLGLKTCKVTPGCILSFFLSPFIICIKEEYWLVWVNFIFSHFTEVVYQLWEFFSWIIEVPYVYYRIIQN
jgi:hypothetical protein